MVLALVIAPAVSAQSRPVTAAAAGNWAACTLLADNAARLACFDRWAAEHQLTPPTAQQPS